LLIGNYICLLLINAFFYNYFLNQFFSTKEGRKQGIQYKVTVSFLEVYNENIRDLLSDVEEYLDLREDPIKGPVVAGIHDNLLYDSLIELHSKFAIFTCTCIKSLIYTRFNTVYDHKNNI